MLIDEKWENGDLVVVALGDKTLWVRITDDRPDQQVEDMGTLWSLDFDFGEEMRRENQIGSYAASYPLKI